MFGDVDIRSLKPRKPQIFLCKPNRQTIAKLNEAYNVNHSTKLGDLNEIEFVLPYSINVRGEIVDNPNLDLVKERYLLRLELGNQKEYYIITKINDSSDDDGEHKIVRAFSLGYQLRDKNIGVYNEIGISAREAVEGALNKTTWSIGSNLSNPDHYFNKSHSEGGAGGRSFDSSSKTALDFLIEVAEAFNAVIIWDTINKTVDFEVPEDVGNNQGFKVSYGKYLQSLGKESNTDEMVTRLYPMGYEGLTIHGYNPTGSGYIEDFSYFMYPYEEDASGNVLRSSNYMTDGLCHAIIKYQKLVDSKRGEFSILLDEQREEIQELTRLQTELFNLQTELFIIEDKLIAQDSIDAHIDMDISYTPSERVEREIPLKDNSYKAIMLRSDINAIVKINGTAINTSRDWHVLRLGHDYSNMNVSIETTNANAFNLKVIVVEVTEDEFNNVQDSGIIEAYNIYNKQEQLDAKESEVDDQQVNVDLVVNDIYDLQASLAMENNYTQEEIVELNEFVIEKEVVNDNIMSDDELYQFSVETFKKMKEPQMVIEIDIVNFLEVVESHRDWNKLNLGDTIKIEHERIGVEVTAKIIEINYDYENQTIKLKIANVKDIKNDEDILIDALYGSISTSTTVDMNKFKWDKVNQVADNVDSIMNSEWDAVKQKIIAGTNESVVIGRRGIQITSPDNPDGMLVANHGVLAISDDGGKSWKNAITSDGVIAERVIGQLIAGETLLISNETGTFKIDKDGVTVVGSSFKVIGEDGVESDFNSKMKEQEDALSTAKQELTDEIGDVNTAVTDLDDYIEGTFKDGIIENTEAKSIETYINIVESEKMDIDSRYTSIYNNTDLKNTTVKSNLKSKKDDYNAKHQSLITTINNAISDGKATEPERTSVNTAFSNYRNSLKALSTAFEDAVENIAENKKIDAQSYAEDIKKELAQDIGDITKDLGDLENYVDVTFLDGVIEMSEAKAIESYINSLESEKIDVDNRYAKVYNNSYLKTSTIKSNLQSKKSSYNTAHSNLISSINTAIADSKTTEAEKKDVDAKFVLYRTSLGALSQAFEDAVEDIAHEMAKEESQAGKNAWAKFSGAGNTLPSGTVIFGNGLTASDIEGATVNFNKRNDRISTTPRNPVVDRLVDGTLVDSIDHTVNTDGSVDISFEWDFDGMGNAGNIDGFIVYVMQGAGSGSYSFGSSPKTEQVFYVSESTRAILLYGVPANKYYTFGVQAYRTVDEDISSSGVLKSAIVKSTASGHDPYRPSANVAFNGQVTGTIGNNTPAVDIENLALGSLQEGTAYNNVSLSTESGLMATRSDAKVRAVMNATSGISIQKKVGDNWVDQLYADTEGNLYLTGNINMQGGSISWDKIGKPSYTAEEVGARPKGWTPTATEVGAYTKGETDGHISDAKSYAQGEADKAMGVATTAQELANTAQETANTAKDNASTAQSTANTAKESAETANNLLSDISSDGKLTPVEKQNTKKEWDIIVSEKDDIVAQGTKYNVSTSAYTTSFNNLNTYVTPLLTNLSTTSNITGTTFRANFKAYYDAKTALLKAVADRAKDLADGAQSTADDAQSVANAVHQTVESNRGVWGRASNFNTDGTINTDKLRGSLTDKQLESASRWNGRTTLIDENGVYTGVVATHQLVAGDAKIDSALIDNIKANQITVGAETSFESGYDPSTKETPNGAQNKANQAETNAKNHADGKDTALRQDLRISSPLPTSLSFNSNGIRATASGTTKYAQFDHRGLFVKGGAIQIERPDGALWVQDGMIQQEYSVSSVDPYDMDYVNLSGNLIDGVFRPSRGFYRAGWEAIVGGGDYNDIRDPDKGWSVKFTSYEFVHSARYLVIGYRKGINVMNPRHNTQVWDGNNRLFIEWHSEGGTPNKSPIILDLGVPTFQVKSFQLRIGVNKGDVSGNNTVIFRIDRVYQTDFI